MPSPRKTRTETELDDILERVTRAEEQLDHASAQVTSNHTEVKDALKLICARLEATEKALTKYQGFIGGIMLVLTVIGTFLTLFWGVIAKKLGWET